jgi:hypothetical protein
LQIGKVVRVDWRQNIPLQCSAHDHPVDAGAVADNRTKVLALRVGRTRLVYRLEEGEAIWTRTNHDHRFPEPVCHGLLTLAHTQRI